MHFASNFLQYFDIGQEIQRKFIHVFLVGHVVTSTSELEKPPMTNGWIIKWMDDCTYHPSNMVKIRCNLIVLDPKKVTYCHVIGWSCD